MHSKCMVKLVSVKQICRICVYQIFLMHRFNVWFQFHTWSFITSIWMLSMEVTTSIVYPPNWNVFPQWSETSKGNRLKCPNMSSSAQTSTNYNSQKKCRIVLFVLLSWYSYHQLTGHPLPSWPSKGVCWEFNLHLGYRANSNSINKIYPRLTLCPWMATSLPLAFSSFLPILTY